METQTNMKDEQRMLTPRETALAIGVCVRTLHRWRKRGDGPMAVELPSGSVRYPSTYLGIWLAARAA